MAIAFESIVPSAGDATDRFTVRRGAGPADHTMQLLTPAAVKTLLSITTADVSGLAAVASSGSASDLGAGTLPAARLPAFGSGDVSFASGGGAGTIANDAVTNAKLANMATASFKGRTAAGTGDPEDLTATQATALLDLATTSVKGLLPARSGVATQYLDGTGAWSVPAGGGGGVSDGDKGDITVSSGGTVWTIDAGVVTLAKQADVATARIMGRVTAGSGVQEALTGTQATTLLDVFTTSAKGLVTSPAGVSNTTDFLRRDGAWAVPAGGGGGSFDFGMNEAMAGLVIY